MQVLFPKFMNLLAGKWQSARQELICHHPECVHVRCARCSFAPPLLRSCIGCGEHIFACVGTGGRLGISGDAEVGQAPMPVESQDVLWLKVTMHNSAIEVG